MNKKECYLERKARYASIFFFVYINWGVSDLLNKEYLDISDLSV